VTSRAPDNGGLVLHAANSVAAAIIIAA
jgi:hypothetical protein